MERMGGDIYRGDLFETLGAIVDVVTAPKCGMCEMPAVKGKVEVIVCKGCGVRVCQTCALDHSCGGGEEPQRIRY